MVATRNTDLMFLTTSVTQTVTWSTGSSTLVKVRAVSSMRGPLLQIIMSTPNGIALQALPDSFTLRRRNQFPKEQKFFTNTEQAIHVIGLCKWLFHCFMCQTRKWAGDNNKFQWSCLASFYDFASLPSFSSLIVLPASHPSKHQGKIASS